MDVTTLRLRVWYETHFASLFHADASPRTLEAYRHTISVWESITDDPVVDSVDQLSAQQLRAKFAARGKPATANKHFRHLNHLFAKLGPRGPRNRDALGLISESPWFKQLSQQAATPKAIESLMLANIYAAANATWRALIVTAFNLGYRRKVLHDLQWENVDFGRRLCTPPEPTSQTKRCNAKPMNGVTVSHLIRIRRPRGNVFQTQRSNNGWYKAWHKILNRAGIEPSDFHFHDLKRACGQALAKAGASHWAVRYMLDHAPADVTGRFYLNPLEELRDVVETLPQPWGDRSEKLS